MRVFRANGTNDESNDVNRREICEEYKLVGGCPAGYL